MAPSQGDAAKQKAPSIERLDPALDKLLAPDAKIEILAEGYEWSEGPIWVKNGGFLLFSDVLKNTVHRWKQGEGAKPYLTPSGYTEQRAARRRDGLQRAHPRSRGTSRACPARRPPGRRDGRAA